ncbi:MAG: hypothetical protein CL484_14905 [Acidobacteria bacterium]|nr:hypothetical protein [Acidobacteriota bacterium]|tara:strand:- start:397 stop:840 length:444 start_codon:yes stop_codon:yes gene_type:complete
MERIGGAGLRVLSLALGIFLFCQGFSKLGWFMDSGFLAAELRGWREFAPPVSQLYLDVVAIPGAPLFARMVVSGELLAGVALVLGYRVRLAASLALVMVLNFHFAMGLLLEPAYLTNGDGLPVVGGLLGLVVGGKQLPFGLSRYQFT